MNSDIKITANDFAYAALKDSDCDRLPSAATNIEEACRREPQNPTFLCVAGAIFSAMNDYERNAEYYGRMVEVDPNRHMARIRYGKILCRLGRFEEAIPHFIFCRGGKFESEAYHLYVIALEESGKWDEAQKQRKGVHDILSSRITICIRPDSLSDSGKCGTIRGRLRYGSVEFYDTSRILRE
jgi:predicted Zn-dependent protease